VPVRVTPLIALENVNAGCDLIEKALKKIGRNGTWLAFNEAVGRSEVPHGVPHQKISAFEKVRDAFIRGDGLGQKFLVSFLPCGSMRKPAISEIINARYGLQRASLLEKASQRGQGECQRSGADNMAAIKAGLIQLRP
jgi:hypothetical protein